MVGKKGYMRTLEVMLAMILTFAFVLYIIPDPEVAFGEADRELLYSLIDNEQFRDSAVNLENCTYKGDNNTIISIFDSSLPSYKYYAVCPEGIMPRLPRKTVNAESIYLTGNITDFYEKKIIKLFYWE